MELDEAKLITGQCVRAGTWFLYGGEPCEVPDVSLAELIEANRLFSEMPPEPSEGGGRVIHTTCEDRLTAALYALKHYGNPHDLLRAVGYELKGRA